MGMASMWGFAMVGIEAVPVRVEAHVRNGLPGVTIVGLPGAAVREAKERVRSGAAQSGLPLPARRITINLSPGDVPKDGPGFDLPVALVTLAACGYVSAEALRGVGAVGEVSLDGLVRSTRGVLCAAESAGLVGARLLITSVDGLPLALEASTVPVVGVRSLKEAVLAVRDASYLDRAIERGKRWVRWRTPAEGEDPEAGTPDVADIVGLEQGKRAIEVAAAGGHHLLLFGPPGAGKTLLARAMAGVLPPLSRQEALEVTRVWSAAGLRDGRAGLVTKRPFRAPHHTASRAALVGGGVVLRPGEVSLAHHGVLFLDELPEFSRDALEALRQPLEERRVVISRRTGASEFPAACTLVAAMNPCPCGLLGHPSKTCRCSAAAAERYRARLSGPLLDRIDIMVEIPPLSASGLERAGRGECSEAVRERVRSAWQFRRARLGAAEATGRKIATEESTIDDEGRSLLRQAVAKEELSGRAYVRVARLARTIADLDGAVWVGPEHVAEALAMRLDDRRVLWS